MPGSPLLARVAVAVVGAAVVATLLGYDPLAIVAGWISGVVAWFVNKFASQALPL